MAQKASVRRVVLQKAQALLNELIQINENAYRQEKVMSLTNCSAADKKDAIDKMLLGGGLAASTDGTGATTSDKLVGILYGTVSVTVDGTATALDWTHLAE